MPLLKFKCDACGKVFDELVSAGGAGAVCPDCGGRDVSRHYQGKCFFGKKRGGGGSCGGRSCAGCKGCGQ